MQLCGMKIYFVLQGKNGGQGLRGPQGALGHPVSWTPCLIYYYCIFMILQGRVGPTGSDGALGNDGKAVSIGSQCIVCVYTFVVVVVVVVVVVRDYLELMVLLDHTEHWLVAEYVAK